MDLNFSNNRSRCLEKNQKFPVTLEFSSTFFSIQIRTITKDRCHFDWMTFLYMISEWTNKSIYFMVFIIPSSVTNLPYIHTYIHIFLLVMKICECVVPDSKISFRFLQHFSLPRFNDFQNNFTNANIFYNSPLYNNWQNKLGEIQGGKFLHRQKNGRKKQHILNVFIFLISKWTSRSQSRAITL